MEFNKAYDREEFLTFLKDKFLPEEDFVKEETVLPFPVQTKYSTKATRLGTCHDTLDLEVYEIRHTSKHDARVGLSKEAFRLLAEEGCARALVLFVPEDDNSNYRFSLIEITLNIKEDSSKIDKSYSDPHRYSYYLGKGIAYHTPNKYLNEKGRVIDEDDLRERFSVEVLTKEFYSELSDWYAWAIQIIRFPNNINDNTDDAKYNNEGAIRLITRLIFVWFLKQRHLIPDEFFDESFIANNLLEGFTPHAVANLFGKSYDSKYYKAILQNLFFAMLNSPITAEGGTELSERHFRNGRGDYDNNKLMRYEDYFSNPQLFVEMANKTVPFLNGGLFDCLDDKDNGMYYDGFSDRESVRSKLAVPDFLFFGEEVGKNIDLSEFYGDKKKKKVSARGIIDILKRYNFTVEENTPFDQEVSLDPELLGKVFENLLAAYNPETQTTARKQTGSFYTPREIVQYMVEESLVAHLKRTVGEEYESEYRQLMEYSDDEIKLSDEIKHQIITSLYNCKILDPACGSGAFPMGMLQQMVHILSRLDPNNEQWRKIMLDDAIAATSDAYRNSTDDERKEIIADIERSFDEAINRPDYARKLYLIENCIYGVDIQPIAIQISKLRFFISLVVDQITNTDATDNFGIRPLPNLEAKFVAANTLIGLKSSLSITDTDIVRNMRQQLKDAKHKIFGAKTVRTKRKYKQRVNELRHELANELNRMGFIDDSDTQQLASWDMFDQNASSPFFDPEWMFDIKDGFDIVIANPPYVQLQANHGSLAKLYIDKGFKSFFKTGDLYCLFFEKGQNLLKYKGLMAYITPNTWLQSITFSPIREFLTTQLQCLQILITYKVFDATVDTHCILFKNERNPIECNVYRLLKSKRPIFLHTLQSNTLWNKTCSINVEASPNVSSLIDKIKENSIELRELFHVYNGVKPFEKGKGNPPQTAQIVNEKPYVIEGKRPNENWMPLMRGSLMNKYTSLWNDNYWILYGEWLAAPRKKEIFLAPHKIIVRQTGDSIIAHCIGPDIICRDNLHICLPIDYKYDLRYCLGILNSKIMDFIYTFINPEKGEALAQVKKAHVEELYIAKASEDKQLLMTKIVEHVLNAKKENSDADVTCYERKINYLAFKLYGLNYDEVKIVDPETPITREEYEA